MTALIIILIVLVILVIIYISIYNTLITLRQQVKNAFGQIDVQLQRRFDLIPNLVECVKGYMTHESEVLENVAKLRSSWADAKTVEEKSNLNDQLSNTLKTIMAVSENYPDLKANQNFIDLQNTLSDTEDKISASRQYYNDIVTKYNTNLQTFPSNIVAAIGHFESEQLFTVDNSEVRKNVKVDFGKEN